MDIKSREEAERELKDKGYEIPNWCSMHPLDHCDGVGGCWGISKGHVNEKGENYCMKCEFHKNNIERVCGECGSLDTPHEAWCSGRD